MAIVVKLPGGRQTPVPDAEDMDVDEMGTLILTRGDGKDETSVGLWAPGAWLSAEQVERG